MRLPAKDAADKPPFCLSGPVFRAARFWASHRARRLVDELRSQIQADGSVLHRTITKRPRWWRPYRREGPRPALITKELNRDEVMGLRRAGLSEEQIWAIMVVGIGSDELNQLFLLGAR